MKNGVARVFPGLARGLNIPELNEKVRDKWLLNTAINIPAGALRLSSNGQLLDRPELDQWINESYCLGEQIFGKSLQSYAAALARVKDVIRPTASNENSMARDTRLGKPTEIDFLFPLELRDKSRFSRSSPFSGLGDSIKFCPPLINVSK